MSEDVFDCHNSEERGVTGIYWVEVKNVTYPTMQRTTSHEKELFSRNVNRATVGKPYSFFFFF